MRGLDRRRSAFTLIESIMAVVVISIMIPPTLVLIRDAQVRRASPILASRARWLATEKLEDVIADRHSATRGWTYLTNASYPAETPVNGFAQFSRSVSIVQTGHDLATSGTGYKRVTVTVSWMDPRHGSATLSLATVLTDFSTP
ncbi:MAG: type II secretion system protein [Phycisphaerae bacterium]|nr:type II secretion system protein [Phycisphaerae bacterium]